MYFTLCSPLDLNTTFHLRAPTILLCHRFSSLTIFGSTGISTSCSSATPFGLTLVPDLLWVDGPSPENLRLSMVWVLATLSLLMPAFSLVCSPQPLSILLLPAYIAPLPIDNYLSIPKLRC